MAALAKRVSRLLEPEIPQEFLPDESEHFSWLY